MNDASGNKNDANDDMNDADDAGDASSDTNDAMVVILRMVLIMTLTMTYISCSTLCTRCIYLNCIRTKLSKLIK